MGKSKRKQFIDLAKKGGTRQDYIDLAEDLEVGGAGKEDDIVVPIEPPVGPKPPGKAKGGLIKKKPKDESMAHEGKESKKKEAQETKLEKKGYKETISGKMVKKAKGGLIKGMPKIALRGY